MGKKSIWETWEEDGDLENILTLVARWSMDGAMDKEMYVKLKISSNTFCKLKKEQPRFREALKKGKEVVDSQVIRQLHKECLGYGYTEEVAHKLKTVMMKNGRRLETERIEITEITRHARPSIAAIIFYLVNRLASQYRRDGMPGGDTDKMKDDFKKIMLGLGLGEPVKPEKPEKD